MRKNLPLYILLLFLIIVNGFFLYNYLGSGMKETQKGPNRPGKFLVKQLELDAPQEEQFRILGRTHHQRMRGLSEDIRELKDELFKGLSDASFEDANIDSIASLIGEKEKLKDLEVYRHFKSVQELCNEEQKEKFERIIEDALRRGGRDQGPPRRGPDGDRPPMHDDEFGDGSPPEHP